jgi:hypothetical protein
MWAKSLAHASREVSWERGWSGPAGSPWLSAGGRWGDAALPIASAVTAARRKRSIASMKIEMSVVTASGRSARKHRSRWGAEITNCQTGTLPIGGWMRQGVRDQCEAAITNTEQLPLLEGGEVTLLRDEFQAKPAAMHWSRSLALVVLGVHLAKECQPLPNPSQ